MPDTSSQPAGTGPRPLVLVIDDSVDVVRLLGLLLQDACDVAFATAGAQGIELARRRLPQLVLLDYQMPGMDGAAVWQVLRAEPATARIPVVFVSAEDPAAFAPDALASGEASWLRKPFRAADVRAAVVSRLPQVSWP